VAVRAVGWLDGRSPDIRSRREHRAARAGALYLAERWTDSSRAYAALLSDHPDADNYAAHVGQVAARLGDVAEARAMSERLARVTAVGILGREARAWAAFERARIAALLGEQQRAVDLLRDAITEGFPINLNIHDNPDFEALRVYGPFVELTRPPGS
jgi:predicted Zn-dependent protease